MFWVAKARLNRRRWKGSENRVHLCRNQEDVAIRPQFCPWKVTRFAARHAPAMPVSAVSAVSAITIVGATFGAQDQEPIFCPRVESAKSG